VSEDVLAGWLRVSGNLPQSMTALRAERDTVSWTDEQLVAIERRQGNLLLAAGAGSGKTSVLVERFVRAVLEDGAEVSAILTITFTEKAAAELRDRIRRRLRELGADEAARATEGAFISTIHGFCARILRAHALAAGLDPAFAVLDQPQAERLADAAFDEALDELARVEGGAVELIASYGAGSLRSAIASVYGELRSRGVTEPALPPLPPAPGLAVARAAFLTAGGVVVSELRAVAEPGVKVLEALDRLTRAESVAGGGFDAPWPGALDALKLPGGNGAALSTAACAAYGEALERFRRASEHARAADAHRLLDRLLRLFASAYVDHKRAASGVDFDDLELMARDLLAGSAELRDRYRNRFAYVMVDELQDTNAVQLELIEQVANGNLFTVGDAQQSIYGFRHADVELFERLGEERERAGERAALQTNFRSRPEILDVVNAAFAGVFGEGFMRLRAGREPAAADEPLVELLVADKAGDWETDSLGSPWRIAEARTLAARLYALIGDGVSPGDVVVLTRATTDLRVYERALEERGLPTYVIGGRGYWGHPQVIDAVAYLQVLANPRNEEALYTVLASPIVGLSVDGLVLVAAAARDRQRDPWWVLREPDGALSELCEDDRSRLTRFAAWLAGERAGSARRGIEELIDRMLERTGYDLELLAMPGGRRRLANVRKLMRLGREWEASYGRDLAAFLDRVSGRGLGRAGVGDPRESEAPVEGEALDAIRLMTIHRAKGLEFDTVCVADLGRGPRYRAPLMRIGRDGRFGLRLGQPGTTRGALALGYREIGDAQAAVEEREERRLFYVAMTRARERLVCSGAARIEEWDKERSPMAWIGPALIEAGVEPAYVREQSELGPAVEGSGRSEGGAAPSDVVDLSMPIASLDRPGRPAAAGAPVSALSYSSLGEYARCGYRFYVERVLRVPGVEPSAEGGSGGRGRPTGGGLSPVDRGILVHELLERLDFVRPAAPSAAAVVRAAGRPLPPVEAEGIAELIGRFIESPLCARLAAASEVRREERFAFLLADEVLIAGALDVLAREPGGRMLVVDYKSDRLDGADPAEVVTAQYATQRLVYALAALRAGAEEVEVAHVFLEVPDRTVAARFAQSDAPELERRLAGLAGGVLRREWNVTQEPRREVCAGCPAEGGLCSWPLEMTRREAVDTLF
jgi:ATP-dependent exoDNAse (exonuclease V) beta subunit